MKKSLSNLLKQLEESQTPSSDANISSLNDALSKVLKKGGYDVTNNGCGGSYNVNCLNNGCSGTTNSNCWNEGCSG